MAQKSLPALTVSALIEKLKNMPPDHQVGTKYNSIGITDVEESNGYVWIVNNTMNMG